MTLQRSGHAYRQGLIAGVVLLCLGPAGARAQSAAGREVTVTAAFDVANAYLLRGINQDDTGVIMWPAVDFGLVVTAGVGRTGVWGGPVAEIKVGDAVWCPPSVKHWHGAAPGSAMTHLALSGQKDGQTVVWMEKVSDAQYGL